MWAFIQAISRLLRQMEFTVIHCSGGQNWKTSTAQFGCSIVRWNIKGAESTPGHKILFLFPNQAGLRSLGWAFCCSGCPAFGDCELNQGGLGWESIHSVGRM